MKQMFFITDAPRIAGSEVWLEQTLPRLAQRGISLKLFVPDQPRLGPMLESLRKTIAVETYSSLQSIAEWNAPEGWIIQAWQPQLYAQVRKLSQKPLFTVIHDQIVYHYPLGLRQLYQTGYQLSKVRWLKTLEGCITVSDWGAAWLHEAFGLKATAIRNGVNVERFRPREDRDLLRQKHGFKRFTVLVPGRFSPEKNQWTSLHTARLLPEMDFIFLGDMDSVDGRGIGALAKYWRLENVQFWGRRSEMPEIYAAGDAVLQPTLAENQSLVTLEAMSAGIPLVSSDIPAQAELIRHQETGFLVKPNAGELAGVLRQLSDNLELARRVGTNARNYILQHHTLEQSAERMAQAILGLS